MDTPSIIDYDVHGLAGIRLVGASSADVAVVTRQLGALIQRPLRRVPEIVVQFVERLPAASIEAYDR